MIIISHSCAHHSILNVTRAWWSWSELVWPILQCRAPWDLRSRIIPAWGGREGRLAAPSVRSMLPPSGAADSPVISSDRWLSAGSGPWLIRAGNEMRDFGCRSAYFTCFFFFLNLMKSVTFLRNKEKWCKGFPHLKMLISPDDCICLIKNTVKAVALCCCLFFFLFCFWGGGGGDGWMGIPYVQNFG